MMIPRQGDLWEFCLPGKRKKRKRIGFIAVQRWEDPTGRSHQRVMVWWARAPKGRHTGIWVHTLLQYGQRLSTQAERDAASTARRALGEAAAEKQMTANAETNLSRDSTHAPSPKERSGNDARRRTTSD